MSSFNANMKLHCKVGCHYMEVAEEICRMILLQQRSSSPAVPIYHCNQRAFRASGYTTFIRSQRVGTTPLFDRYGPPDWFRFKIQKSAELPQWPAVPNENQIRRRKKFTSWSKHFPAVAGVFIHGRWQKYSRKGSSASDVRLKNDDMGFMLRWDAIDMKLISDVS